MDDVVHLIDIYCLGHFTIMMNVLDWSKALTNWHKQLWLEKNILRVGHEYCKLQVGRVWVQVSLDLCCVLCFHVFKAG